MLYYINIHSIIICSGRILLEVQVNNMDKIIIKLCMPKENKIKREYLKENLKQEYLPVKLIDKINRDIFNTKLNIAQRTIF